jgi:hypothetical protein
VTEAPLSLSFFDPVRKISGTARAGMTLLFENTRPTTIAEGPENEQAADGTVRARLAGRFDLSFAPLAEPASLAGSETALAAVTGTVGGTSVDCLGTITRTVTPPGWADLDAVRGLSAVFDRDRAVFAIARRPRGVFGHGQELIEASILVGGEQTRVENTRLSTVYDGDGRQRDAGLELWLPGEDFPRRVSGSAQAGASLALEGLRVNAAVFRWRWEGHEGMGLYELASRDEQEAA